MPKEIVRDRLIAQKKPWAVAAMLGLLTAAVVNFAGMFLAWHDWRNGSDYDIYVQHVSTAGTSAWTANGLAVCTAAAVAS